MKRIGRTSRLGLGLAAAALAALVVPGTAEAAPAAPDSCGGTAWAPPGTVWGPVSQTTTGVAGSPGWRQGYSFTVQGSGASPVVVQAKGFNDQGKETWYGLGAASDSGGGTVSWGNVLATPAIRATSANVFGAEVTWTC